MDDLQRDVEPGLKHGPKKLVGKVFSCFTIFWILKLHFLLIFLLVYVTMPKIYFENKLSVSGVLPQNYPQVNYFHQTTIMLLFLFFLNS